MEELIGQNVVVDLRSSYVCIGKLRRVEADFLELSNADFHDLRDTQTSRENYVAETRFTGIKRNRKRVLVMRLEVVAVSALEDVVEN